MVLKFPNDPMVNESRIVVLLRQVWVYAREIDGFGEGRENEIERKKKHKDVGLKTDLICLYFPIK